MILLYFSLFVFVKAATVYKIVTSGTCTDNPSGHKITDKVTCQEQATALGFTDTTATTVAMSGTIPGGCVFIQIKEELKVYDSTNKNQCSDEFKCICEYTASNCQYKNENDCVCDQTICTRKSGLSCNSGTCSHASECPTNEGVCRCDDYDCTPTSGLVCDSGQCKHAPECVNKLGLLANTEICQCGDFDCQNPFCVAASSTCRPACPAGTFVTNQNTCQDCSVAGYYCPEGATQSETTFSCPVGRYSASAGIHSKKQCVECPVGRYSNVPATTENCNICGSNTYQDVVGQTKCKGCPNEKIIHDATSADKHDSVDDCEINVPTCSSNEYLGNNTCQSCSESYMCDGNSKEICPAGHFCIGNGPADECPTGRYGERLGQNNINDACLLCSAGTFQTVPGQTYCSRSCPLGKYGWKSGAKNETEACHDCPVGHMCGTMAMQQSVQCSMGTYQDTTGKAICKQCPQGMYSDYLGAIVCTTCGKDELGNAKQTAGLGSNSESQCAVIEKTCPGAQRPVGSCENCPQGFYANGLGTRCRICPKGKRQPRNGQYSCLECSECEDLGHDVYKIITANVSDHEKIVRQAKPYKQYNWVNIIVYASLLGTVLLIILSHRMCPDCIKHLDFLFSGDHLVEDTHARRILNTRLGAAFTLSIPFIVAAISVFVFTDENVTEHSSLVPEGTVTFNQDLKNMYIEYESWYANGQQNCRDIVVDTECDFEIHEGLPCLINMTCKIDKDFSGTHNIDFILPDNQQKGVVKVWPDAWMRQYTEIYKTLQTDTGFVGTVKEPTMLAFSMKKCKYVDSVANTEQDGIKINTHDIQKQESRLGTKNGKHVIRLQFSTSESIFLYKVDAKMTILTQFSTVLTLLISVISSLRTIKILLGNLIDGTYKCCCKQLPLDIQKRQNILNENNPVQIELNRRLSTLEQKTDTEVHVDETTGKRYSYCRRTKKSEWIL